MNVTGSGRLIPGLSTLTIAIALAMPATAQEAEPGNPLDQFQWSLGPTTADLGPRAKVEIPAGFRFVGASDTQSLLEMMGNPISGEELGIVMPDSGDWFVVFEFDEIGYVKDDEKDKLDADAILNSIRTGTEQANKVRAERGWAPLNIVGWQYPPAYNSETNNLEWAIRAESEGEAVLNYNMRVLGRKGVMEAALVIDPELLKSTLPTYRQLLAGFTYKDGERYAEFQQGDQLAKYGLSALVAGGAAAVALKTGFLQKFGKLILVAFVAVAGAFKSFFNRLFGKRQSSSS